MCSVDPDELTEMIYATEGLDVSRGDVLCRKCKEAVAEVVLRAKDAYCRHCFLSYFEHKFRSTIGKSKQIRPGDRILVATSGGASSAALLNLISSGLDENSHKRLRFEPTFLYIDESCICEDINDKVELIPKVCSEVVSLGFPCYVTSIQQVMASEVPPPATYREDWMDMNLESNESLKKQLCDLVNSCRTTTTQQDLHERLRLTLIVQCAQVLGFKKIFLGDNSTTLSICILSQVALGRGSHLPYEVHFKTTMEDVEIYRPMREILENEILYYVKLYKLTTVETSTPHHEGTSITQCTEEFVRGLQKEFPATIPTVFRTGDKLEPASPSLSSSRCSTPGERVDGNSKLKMKRESEPCVLCKFPLDTDRGDASALHATLVSQKLSQLVSGKGVQQKSHCMDPDTDESASNAIKEESLQNCDFKKLHESVKKPLNEVTDSCMCGSNSSSCSAGKTTSSRAKQDELLPLDVVESHMCYGCRIITRDMKDVGHLPVRVQRAVGEQERFSQMRKQIQDFLL